MQPLILQKVNFPNAPSSMEILRRGYNVSRVEITS